MMEIGSLDSAKWQKSRRRDMIRIFVILNDNGTKDEQCSSSQLKETKKNMQVGNGGCSSKFFIFLEREGPSFL